MKFLGNYQYRILMECPPGTHHRIECTEPGLIEINERIRNPQLNEVIFKSMWLVVIPATITTYQYIPNLIILPQFICSFNSMTIIQVFTSPYDILGCAEQ